MDNKFLELVGLFLKAGVSVDGVVQPTEKGVPQGGVLSPLLANVVLNRLDWFLHNKGVHGKADLFHNWAKRRRNVRFVRYADDWCVFITRASKQYAAAIRDEIRDFIKDTAGLELSAEKTKITHVGDGFDFLGFRLSRGTGQRGVTVPKIKIGDKAKKSVRLRLSEALRYRPQQESIALRIKRASHLIRGWREYYRIAHDFSRHTGKLDNHAFWDAVKAISRKSDMTTAQSLKRHYRRGRLTCGDGNTLEKFSDASMKLDYRGPKEYVPGGEAYLDDFDDQSTFTYRETKRRYGSYDMRWEVMVRDSLCCRKCGKVVDYSTARIDHIIPVKNFASFRLAHRMDNLQTLCISCHKGKTSDE